ncbi:hypothetical protein FACS1894214_4070 [Planctomycetales bacterium]|nr:hypothetical protein FACS1894214_4070 [Planctomycetales bacterium]
MSGVGIICFASSYLIALCLEISRIFFRSAVRNVFVLLWIFAGLVAHTIYLYYHTALFPEVDSAKTYFLISAWGLVIADICLLYFRPKTPFGIVILPLVLLLICGAVLVSGTSEPVQRTELNFLIQCKNVHTGTFLIATLALSIGFTAGVLYLIQDRQLRLKRPPFSLFLLPSLEWSMKICRYSVWVSLLFLIASIASGVLLKINITSAKQVSVLDPLVSGTLILFIFLACFCEQIFTGKGKPVALSAIFVFLFLAAVLAFAVLLNNSHWQGVIK